MELAQKAEMVDEARRLRGKGDPQAANLIMKSLDRDEFYLGLQAVPELEKVEAPSPKAKKAVWVAFAKENSGIDDEIIDSATKNDIIGMLDANGLLD
jgi:hypothetical protein